MQRFIKHICIEQPRPATVLWSGLAMLSSDNYGTGGIGAFR